MCVCTGDVVNTHTPSDVEAMWNVVGGGVHLGDDDVGVAGELTTT